MSYKASNLIYEKHNFFGSTDGVSGGVYSSLNTNDKSLDRKENVAENFEIIANSFGLRKNNLMIQNQGFTNIVNYVENASYFEVTGDGLVTDKENIILCVRIADCAPVLFEDRKNNIIGGAHAGWRSALKGVIENTLDLMIEKGAEIKNIKSAIGPCLQKKSFEAGKDMLDMFVDGDKTFAKYFEPKGNKFLFDFEKFIYDKLVKYGLENITKSGIDTYTDKNYFSFRRSTHAKEIKQPGDFPTQLATIIL